MLPILFNIGPFLFRSYGVLLAVGYLFGTFLFWREGKKLGYSEEKLLDLSIIALITGLIGARFYYAVLNWSEFSVDPVKIFAIWEGGLAFHGALLAIILAGIYFVRKVKWSFLQVADIASLGAVIASIFGKIGAFLSGADLGAETDLPWGVRFFGSVGLRHPVQIYEVVWLLIVFVMLNKIRRKNKNGVTFFSYLALTGVGRFLFEFLRVDSSYLFGFKIAQLVSLMLVLIGLVSIYYLLGRPNLKILFGQIVSEIKKTFTETKDNLRRNFRNGFRFLQRKTS